MMSSLYKNSRKCNYDETYSVELLCIIPGLDQAVPDGVRRGLISAFLIEIEPSAGQSVLDVVNDGALDRTLISTDVRAHELPHLFLASTSRLAELWAVECACFTIILWLTCFLLGHVEA